MLKRLFLFLCGCAIHYALAAQDAPINIWEGTACQTTVKLTPFLAPGQSNTACIICPGGSYFWLDRETEGVGVAQWLQSQGISAFVLEYRVGGVLDFVTHYRLLARGNRFPDMLQDVQRSIQLLREQAQTFHIDPDRLGVMGFSAGGHLAAMSGVFAQGGFLELLGIRPGVSLKPNFIASIYPVVSLVDESAHKRSRRGLLGDGEKQNTIMRDSLSLEKHIPADMPPTYLMNCIDDPIVDYRNGVLLQEAMTRQNVPHRYTQYQTGGHGFGANPEKTTEEAIRWKEDFMNWLREIWR